MSTDSAGKSGARLFLSRDKRYFIKTLVSEEVEMMHHILKQYHQVSETEIWELFQWRVFRWLNARRSSTGNIHALYWEIAWDIFKYWRIFGDCVNISWVTVGTKVCLDVLKSKTTIQVAIGPWRLHCKVLLNWSRMQSEPGLGWRLHCVYFWTGVIGSKTWYLIMGCWICLL